MGQIFGRKIRKWATLALAASLLAGLLPASMGSVEASGADYNLRNPIRHENGDVTWETIYFGHYWQNDTNGDGKADKNDEKEPIRWRVLDVANGEALLLADKNLECGMNFSEWPNLRHIWNIPDWVSDDDPQLHPPYDAFMAIMIKIVWENSDIRSWLNGYNKLQNMNGYDYTDNNFIDNAFSETEQDAIVLSNLNTLDEKEYDPDDADNSHDQIFLLSRQETMMPAYGFMSATGYEDVARTVWNTQYAADMAYYGEGGVHVEDNWRWWTRSSNQPTRTFAGSCFQAGGKLMVEHEQFPVTEPVGGCGVRPALRLKLSESDQWSYGRTVTMTADSKLTDVKPDSPEILPKLPETLQEAKYDVLAAVSAVKVSNTTTADEILAAAEKRIAGAPVSVEAAGELERTPATAKETGRAALQFRITMSDGTNDTVSASWGIPPLDGWTRSEREKKFKQAKNILYQFTWDYLVSNETTADELLAEAKARIPDELCITLSLPWLKVNKSNYWTAGGLESGYIMLCNGYYDLSYNGKTIETTKTPTADEAAVEVDMDAVRTALKAMKVMNKTTEADITKVAKAAIRSGCTIEFSKGTFQKTNATSSQKGKASILYRLTHGDAWHEMYVRWDIPKTTGSSSQGSGGNNTKPGGGSGAKPGGETAKLPKKGTVLTSRQNNVYKVLKPGATVAYAGTKSTAKTISVPSRLTYNGVTYAVTEISANAFKNNRRMTKVVVGSNITKIGASAFRGCKKLKNITINSTKLKSVGKKAFTGTYSKAKAKVPSRKRTAYKKLLKGKGLNKKAKIS